MYYRPSTPAGLPPEYPLPTPRRPRILGVFVWVAVILLLAGCCLLTILAISSVTGVVGLVTGVVLAAIPVFPVVGTFLWLDRYEAEPASLLVFAFAWGAGVSTFVALVVNTASVAALQAAGGDVTAGAVVVAPIVEESMKGLAVVAIVLLRRREFNGVVDGLVYAGLAGIGFAFVENVLYLGRTLAEVGSTGAATVFLLRCVVSPFAHPLFTAATGVGIGVAVSSHRKSVRLLAPVGGWLIAVALHGAWNLSASSGLAGFLSAYVAVQVPVFVAVVVLALLARQREGRLIARHLAVYANTGWLSPREVVMLGSLPERREAQGWASRIGGPGARRAMRDFQELGSELAFLRERIGRGTAPPDAQAQEYALLAAMSQLRARFVPAWMAV